VTAFLLAVRLFFKHNSRLFELIPLELSPSLFPFPPLLKPVLVQTFSLSRARSDFFELSFLSTRPFD